MSGLALASSVVHRCSRASQLGQVTPSLAQRSTWGAAVTSSSASPARGETPPPRSPPPPWLLSTPLLAIQGFATTGDTR